MNILVNQKLPPFALDNRMTVVLFAGMGGGCDGLEQAGFHVHLAINHDPIAVAVHKARHPHTRHERCDVFEVCPKKATNGRGVRVLHASPDCTHFSVAKGGKPVSKRRRSLAWVICRWAGQVRPETITLENVPEIQTWGPLIAKRCPHTGRVMRLDGSVAAKGERVPVQEQWLIPDPKHKGRIWTAWRKHMAGLDYNFEGKVLVCADYGIATIRKRFFGILQADGGKIVWPERTHAPRKIAKSLGLKPWVGAHTIIDFSIPVKSIFGRKKDLAPATLRRTARGVMRYVIEAAKPFIVPITHSGADRVHSLDEPLRTLTTAHRGELSVVVPHVAVMRNSGKPYSGADEPLQTLTAGGANPALISAFLAQHNSDPRANGSDVARKGRCVEEPIAALTTSPQIGVSAVFLAQHNDGPKAGISARDVLDPVSALTTTGSQQGVVAASMLNLRGSDKAGRDMREPVSTLCANGNHAGLILGFLQHYYGTGGQDQSLADPLGALTSKARHGLVTVKVGRETFVITDIGMRMLEPEEGAAAHGFAKGSLPDTIVLDGKTVKLTKTQKYHLVGNSVPPHMVRLLAECNVRRELVLEAAE
ncbi:DNA cytosine methyltransferase [Agrobacterium vitis]|uniref:DNA (cytosine-5-)-methyltransferase n=1 Tax=Agrobacterium vitis TaxID=373 RepID=A0ABD6G6C3_AGRVI|nr:DNA cytosine methyltransferase [Agrobacterium vitis]MUO77642.1 DNA cytosine methyltransferase [Agrobacterium vitis]MUO93159.1 DNA cytosine methyltransferase [Agrobacterium vitis]MUP04510.1 DNA cytosine methyltransferase [Agrobacterium vitis]